MNVLIVGQYFWPENFRINEVAESLARAGCAVSVLTGPPNYPGGKVFPGYRAGVFRTERHGSVDIHRVPQVTRGSGSSVRLALNYLSFVFSASIFGPVMLRKRNVDVILVYAPGPILQAIPAIWIGFLKRAKVVTWVQDLWPESLEVTQFVRNKVALNAIERCVRWIYRRNDLLLVQSQAFIDPVVKLAGRTPVIYHPNPGELPAERSNSEGEPVLRLNAGFNIVFAGNLGTVQALDTVLAAAELTREHPDIWWVMVGGGSRRHWLDKEVKARDLKQVVMAGQFPPQSMPSIFKQSSALLVSLVRSPIMSMTVPSKIQAYLAAARPIIACLDGEGARVVADAGAGLTCPAEDAAALAERVMRMKRLSAEERERMGAAGKRYYEENFDPQFLTRQLLDHLRRVVSDPQVESERVR